MRPVSTAAEVRELDRRTIDDVGVPGVALMETASRGVATAIRAHHAADARRGVVVVCGGGNNGGDGYCVARWLHGWGFPVRIWALGPSAGDALLNRLATDRLGIPGVDGLGDAGLIVDAVFGTGLAREVTGRYADAVRAMAAHPAPVVAVDLPSGLHADTGQVLGVCAPAVRTVTFGRLKPGLLTEPGATLAGVVDVVDIGIEVGGVPATAEVPDPEDLAPIWPARAPADHKGRSGHLAIVAGSEAMAGAAILACQGALAAGVGLLTLVTARGAAYRLGGLPPEVMVRLSGEATVEPTELGRHTAIAVGPGLGAVSAAAGAWLRGLSGVFDADGLPWADAASVITPHPGEAGRLLGVPAEAVQADRFAAARDLAAGRVALLKGRHTLVAAPGAPVSVNPTGSAALATGGSGDVLTGVIGALLAHGASPRDAARLGAWVHGRAGERLAARRAQGWTASDVAAEIPAAIADLTG